jgi:hypothetical protein
MKKDTGDEREKNPAAVALGRLGGRWKGKKGLAVLSAEKRLAISRTGSAKSAEARKRLKESTE